MIREFFTVLPLLLTMSLLPWLFGGVHTSSQLLLVGSVIVALFVRVLVLPASVAGLPTALVPLVLAVLLGAAQLLPLGSYLNQISPQAQQMWSDLVPVNGPLAVELGPTKANSTISLYPWSTRHDLILLATAVAVFFLASQLFGQRKWQRILFLIIAANGAAFSFVGIAQQLVWDGRIYGKISLSQGGRPFAAFVNSNNGGGYLNLCMAAAIGFLLLVFSRANHSGGYSSGHSDSDRPNDAPSEADDSDSPKRSRRRSGRRSRSSSRQSSRSSWLATTREAVTRELAEFDGKKLLSVVMVILIFTGLLCTVSRGTWLAMALSATGVVLILAANKRLSQAVGGVAVVILLGAGFVNWLGRTESIAQRWESFRAELTNPSDGRLGHWPTGLRAGSDYWLFGSGLGTYRYVYRPYAAIDDVWFYHAENQYIEAFCEGGIVGLSLMLAAIGAMGIACRNLLRSPTRERRICGIVGVYALSSQVLQALFDFGLYLPANTILFALLCGVVAGANALPRGTVSRPVGRLLTFSRRPDLQAVFAGVLFFGLLLGLDDLRQGWATESSLKANPVEESFETDSVESVTEQIRQLSAATLATPGQADGELQLARLWVQRYRLRYLDLIRPQARPGVTDQELWSQTAPLVVHRSVYSYIAQGRTIELENIRRSEPVRADLKNAARALVRAIHACPLMPRAHLLLAEIAPVVSPDSLVDTTLPQSTSSQTAKSNQSRDLWFTPVRVLAGGNAQLLRECAVAQFQAGLLEDGLGALGHLVALQPAQLIESLRLATVYAGPELIVDRIAPKSPHKLVEAAGSDYFRESGMRETLLVRASDLLEEAVLDRADRSQLEGSIHQLSGRVEQAIESLQDAVVRRPEMTPWRYQLATLLNKHGDLEGARKQILICVNLEPGNEQFAALYRQLR
jgi:O-antigen ligase